MIVKVCGMRDADNIESVATLGVDMVGFIFYPKSPRYLSGIAPKTPRGVARVGVFVDQSIEIIIETAIQNELSHIQLHGDENTETCDAIRQKGYRVIKAISIATTHDIQWAKLYQGHVDLLILDTKCEQHGGSGRQFDWSLLDRYTGETPFLLSGGISEDNANDLRKIAHPKFIGVDLNSKFEHEPALKDIDKLKNFLKNFNTMNRIDKLFSEKSEHILSVFYPAAYPKLEDTLPVLRHLQSKGVDMVEIGIPFSDPMADGRVIQQASSEALRNGISLRKIFDQLANLRADISIPVILMGYLNPIMQFGFEHFCQKCSQVGVDGVIIPDLPFDDYLESYKPIADRYALNMIMLITPQTDDKRIRMIDAHTKGFVYMVSSASTTGVQCSFDGVADYFEHVAAMGLKNPRLIGFGVSNSATFLAACASSSGAIVGSHFVKLLSEYPDKAQAVDKLIESLHSCVLK